MLPFDITGEAALAAKTKLIARGTPSAAIRLGVRGGMCSGFAYVVEYEDGEPGPRDEVITQDGVRFIIDRKSLVMLSGTRVTWKSQLLHSGFEFENPNEASRCGCGASFTPK